MSGELTGPVLVIQTRAHVAEARVAELEKLLIEYLEREARTEKWIETMRPVLAIGLGIPIEHVGGFDGAVVTLASLTVEYRDRLKIARNLALEEAAVACEERGGACEYGADDIRKLKT